MVRGKPGSWDPSICLGWGERFLAFVKEAVQGDVRRSAPDKEEEEEKPPVVWRVEFKPGAGVTIVQLDPKAVEEEVQADSDRSGFLPKWYWEEILRNPA